MKNLFQILFVIALVSACNKPATSLIAPVDMSTLRTLEGGQIIGSITENGSHRWAGIAFAKPPIGNLRWRAPRKAQPWSGVFQANDASSRCPQKTRSADNEKTGQLVGNEDCLHLNIWAPAFEQSSIPQNDQRLPVMVFIHGGSNIWGYGGQYDSQNLAKRHDLVVVTINYRLGPLGWFSQSSLQQDNANPDDNSPNFANLDMIAALDWVQSNISVFGGNPDQVTIFGESAGGQNIASLLAIERAQGLFAGAIIQSGYFTSRSIQQQQQGLQSSVGWSFKGDDEIVAALAPSAELFDSALTDFLRNQSVQDLFAAAALPDGEPSSPRIINDGLLISRQGLEYSLKNAPHPIVPLVTGVNRDELKLFHIANPRFIKKAFGILPRSRDPQIYNLLSKHQSTMWRVRAVDDQAKMISARNHNPVFAYRFDWDEQGSFMGSDFAHLLGAAHALEIPFIFDGFATFPIGGERIFPKDGAIERDQLSRAMMSYWAEFAYSGDPGRGRDGDLPVWQSWVSADEAGQLIIFDTQSSDGVRMSNGAMDVKSAYQALGDDTKNLPTQTRCLILDQVIGWFPETQYRANYSNINNC